MSIWYQLFKSMIRSLFIWYEPHEKSIPNMDAVHGADLIQRHKAGLASTQPKNGNCRDARYISWYNYSSQVDTTIVLNPILYFYCVENVIIWVIWNTIREFVTEKLMRLWWNRPRLRDDISASCQAATWSGWFQHRIHRVLPYATCDLTILLHNY